MVVLGSFCELGVDFVRMANVPCVAETISKKGTSALRFDWKAVVGFGISAFLLWWVFRGQDLGAIAQQLSAADPLFLMATAAVLTSGGLIRALRWRLLLLPLGVPTTLNARWKAVNIGFMASNLFPARLGEVIRPFALSRMAPLSMSGTFGTIALERLLDGIALPILLLATLLAPNFPSGATVMGGSIDYAVWIAVLYAAVVISIAAVLLLWPNSIPRIARAIAVVLPSHAGDKLIYACEKFLTGLAVLRQPRVLVQGLLWSLFLWLWMALAFWCAFRAFGIELGFNAAMFTQCAVSLFVAIPAGPGFIGTLQAGVAVGVHEVFGVASDSTLSLAVGYHLAGFIPITLLGLVYAWALGLHFRSMAVEAETAQ